jgi:hypothetical protein
MAVPDERREILTLNAADHEGGAMGRLVPSRLNSRQT